MIKKVFRLLYFECVPLQFVGSLAAGMLSLLVGIYWIGLYVPSTELKVEVLKVESDGYLLARREAAAGNDQTVKVKVSPGEFHRSGQMATVRRSVIAPSVFMTPRAFWYRMELPVGALLVSLVFLILGIATRWFLRWGCPKLTGQPIERL